MVALLGRWGPVGEGLSGPDLFPRASPGFLDLGEPLMPP